MLMASRIAFKSVFSSLVAIVISSLVCVSPATVVSAEGHGGKSIAFASAPGHVEITAAGQPVGTYVYADRKITRPFLANVFAPNGVKVTRNHPPQPDDPQDHPLYHPGIFLAFGDISGHDYWRLKAKVVHDGFEQRPRAHANRGSFVVRNRYLSTDGRETICIERCKLTFVARPAAYHLLWDSSFSSTQGDFTFGDQEEMGLGVRVASSIREMEGNGRILSSEGLVGAAQTWGQPAAWCDYAGQIGGQHVGVAVMAAPANLRSSWWHNRDYGVFVANLFGRNAMGQGPPSRIVVNQGDTFRLRYAIVVHTFRDAKPNLTRLYQHYVDLLESQ